MWSEGYMAARRTLDEEGVSWATRCCCGMRAADHCGGLGEEGCKRRTTAEKSTDDLEVSGGPLREVQRRPKQLLNAKNLTLSE